MHNSVMDFVAGIVTQHHLAASSVLEVGSYNENGTVRSLFTGPYHGVDTREGPGVDQTCDGENLPFPSDAYDLVVCTEVLEHTPRPWRIVHELAYVTARNGHVIVTARGFNEHGCFQYHPYPVDLWRFTKGAFEIMLADAGLDRLEIVDDPEAPGVFAHARKPPRN